VPRPRRSKGKSGDFGPSYSIATGAYGRKLPTAIEISGHRGCGETGTVRFGFRPASILLAYSRQRCFDSAVGWKPAWFRSHCGYQNNTGRPCQLPRMRLVMQDAIVSQVPYASYSGPAQDVPPVVPRMSRWGRRPAGGAPGTPDSGLDGTCRHSRTVGDARTIHYIFS
jgi:hypothetical protein